VTTHAVAGAKFLRRDTDRCRFLAELAFVVAKCEWPCLAVAVLDNHYHLLVRISKPNLALGMQRLTGAYAADFNRRYKREGHLWGARYYNGPVQSTAHLLATIRKHRQPTSSAATPADLAMALLVDLVEGGPGGGFVPPGVRPP
jgi:REP element-mobilizing transposase RayT